jgi:hypothetical protein
MALPGLIAKVVKSGVVVTEIRDPNLLVLDQISEQCRRDPFVLGKIIVHDLAKRQG